jgi:hypothetical protein
MSVPTVASKLGGSHYKWKLHTESDLGIPGTNRHGFEIKMTKLPWSRTPNATEAFLASGRRSLVDWKMGGYCRRSLEDTPGQGSCCRSYGGMGKVLVPITAV